MLNKIYEYLKSFIKYNYKEIIFLAIFAFVSFYNLPYIVYKPGGSIDLSPRVEIENKSKINGSYSMNYVTVSRGNIPTVLMSYLIKDWELVKESNMVYENTDYETSFKMEQLEYENAIFLAIYNACIFNEDCSMEIIKENIYIFSIDERSNTDLKIMDKIVSMDGKEYDSFEQLRSYIMKKKPGDTVNFTVIENGKEVEKSAIIFDDNGTSRVGITGYATFDYKTNPEINIITRDSEAGPSGGLMLTLAIYDYLSDNDVARGRKIMGTGTIDAEGNIGPIGGIKYKMLGAKKDKADIFFAPMGNCEEANSVKKEYGIKYEVKCVESFSEAVKFLTTN